MIAEIYHKKVTIASEDQLTGNVFGALRYLPYSIFREILIDCASPSKINSILDKSLPVEIKGNWGQHVYFWRHYLNSRTEPDLIIELEDAVILIEVKYKSGLSGDNQLIKESELLIKNYSNKEKFLILLAGEEAVIPIFKEEKDKIPTGVSFGFISWQKLFDAVSKKKDKNLICEDLSLLLKEKGFAGFRGFTSMNEETIKAFRLVQESHKNVQSFISHCIRLAEEEGEFELAPMTGSNTFLRWSSDLNSDAWLYYSFIVVFQDCKDSRLENGYRDGPLYIMEVNFANFEIPVLNLARYDYDNISENWSGDPISPSSHWIFYDPLYAEIIDYPEYETNEMYCGTLLEPLTRYWGLTRVMGYEIALSEITDKNSYEKVFGTFKELSRNL